MEVNKQNLNIWRRFMVNEQYEGNFMKLVERTGLNYKTVKKAIETGKASTTVIASINKAAAELVREFERLNSPIA